MEGFAKGMAGRGWPGSAQLQEDPLTVPSGHFRELSGFRIWEVSKVLMHQHKNQGRPGKNGRQGERARCAVLRMGDMSIVSQQNGYAGPERTCQGIKGMQRRRTGLLI